MRFVTFFLSLLMCGFIYAQNNGESIYQFIELPNSAIDAALSKNISIKSVELSLTLKNPALLDSTHHKDFSFTWSGIGGVDESVNLGYLGYSYTKNGFSYAFGTQFVNYGEFAGYDEYGNETGNFVAGDYMFFMSCSRQLTKKISVGANVKPVLSFLESYTSIGILTDYGVAYNDTANLFSVGLVLSNVGFQLSSYSADNKEKLPWGIDLSITKKLKHAPLRVHLTYQNIQKFRQDYTSPLDEDVYEIKDEPVQETWIEDFADNFIRHIIIGGELLLGKSLYGAFSYNFKKRMELKIDNGSGLTGMALGFGLRLPNMNIAYGRNIYHAAGASNYISFELNFRSLSDKLKSRSETKLPSDQ